MCISTKSPLQHYVRMSLKTLKRTPHTTYAAVLSMPLCEAALCIVGLSVQGRAFKGTSRLLLPPSWLLSGSIFSLSVCP